VARARARHDFYGFDLERRMVGLWKRLRAGETRQQPGIAED
jgi:hypothetical protein